MNDARNTSPLPTQPGSAREPSETPVANATKNARLPKWKRGVREVIAALIWTTALIKLFVFDVDRWLADMYLPQAHVLLNFKLAMLFFVLIILALSWRRHMTWRWLGFILLYPIIVPARVPIWIIKSRNWVWGLAVVALTASILRSFRSNFLLSCVLGLGTIVCAFGGSPWLLIPGAGLLSMSLLYFYWRTVAAAFRPTLEPFSSGTLTRIWSFLTTRNMEPSNVSLQEMNEDEFESQTKITQLEFIVIYNRFCYFLAHKLRELQGSSWPVISYSIRLVLLFVVTLWVVFLLNLSLFRVDPSSFSGSTGVTGFEVFYYSFLTLFGQHVTSIAPVTVVAKSLAMVATTLNLVVVFFVLAFMITTVLRSQEQKDIDDTILALRNQASEIEPYLGEHYGMTIEEAIEQLREMEAAFIRLLYRLSPSILDPD